MYRYFNCCQSTQDARTLYRHLCKSHHPDLHPDNPNATKEMQAINAEYDLFCKTFRPEEMRQRAKENKWKEPTQDDFDAAWQADIRVREAIEKIIRLSGLEIEVCGVWVWVGGSTRENKDALKAAGYHWAPKKARWYFAGKPASPWARGAWTMDDIRDYHGSTRVHAPKEEAHAPDLDLLLGY